MRIRNSAHSTTTRCSGRRNLERSMNVMSFKRISTSIKQIKLCKRHSILRKTPQIPKLQLSTAAALQASMTGMTSLPSIVAKQVRLSPERQQKTQSRKLPAKLELLVVLNVTTR